MLNWLGSIFKNQTTRTVDRELTRDELSPEELMWNGLVLSGVALPEPVLEIILSRVPVKDIRNVKRVCQVWNDITKRVVFWKYHFEYNKMLWSRIPDYVKEKENGWLVMYKQASQEILSANLVKNHSGSSNFDHWAIVRDGGHRIKAEGPPIGCDPLPDDPAFPDSDVCFVTSFDWSKKRQIIDLWKEGLTPETIYNLLPFRIQVTEMYTARFDCGGMYYLSVHLKDFNNSHISFKKQEIQIPQTMEWKTAEINFDFRETGDSGVIQRLRYLVFKHGGRDNQFWAGHFGTKMARASVRIIPLGDPNDLQYSSEGAEEASDEELQPLALTFRMGN